MVTVERDLTPRRTRATSIESVRATVDAEPGRIDWEYQADFTGIIGGEAVTIPTPDLSGGILRGLEAPRPPGPGDATLTISAENIEAFRERVLDEIESEIRDRFNLSSSTISSLIRGRFPETSAFSVTRDFPPIGFLGGEVGVDSGTIDLPELSIPDVPGFSIEDAIERVANETGRDVRPQLRFTIKSDSFIDRLLAGSVSVPVPIPIEDLIQTRDVGDFSCGELYSDAQQAITNLRNRINPLVSRTRRDLNRLENIAGRLEDAGSTFTSFERRSIFGDGGIPDLSGIDIQQVQELGESTLRQMREDAQAVNPRPINLAATRNDLRNLRNRIEGLERPQCVDEFMDRFEDLQDNFDLIEDRLDQIRELRDEILGLLSISNLSELFDIERPTGPCSDRFSTVSSRIQSLSRSVRNFQNTNIRDRSASRFRSLRDEVERTEDLIESRVDDASCAQQFFDTVDSLDDTLRSAFESSTVNLPCEDQVPRLANDIEDFQEDVVRVDPRDAPRQAGRLARRGRDLAERVRDADNITGDCADEFASELEAAIDGLEDTAPEVRIRIPGQARGRSERRVEFEQLRAQIEQILSEARSRQRQIEFELSQR